MDTETFEIYWKDLTEEAQERFRENMQTDPDDSNWDTFPMTVFETNIIHEWEEDLPRLFKTPPMRKWLCRWSGCDHEVIAQERPDPDNFVPSHTCHFNLLIDQEKP